MKVRNIVAFRDRMAALMQDMKRFSVSARVGGTWVESKMSEFLEDQRKLIKDFENLDFVETGGEMKQILATTIPCQYGPAWVRNGICCGCLNAEPDEAKNVWVFRCNECGTEQGRGALRTADPKKGAK